MGQSGLLGKSLMSVLVGAALASPATGQKLLVAPNPLVPSEPARLEFQSATPSSDLVIQVEGSPGQQQLIPIKSDASGGWQGQWDVPSDWPIASFSVDGRILKSCAIQQVSPSSFFKVASFIFGLVGCVLAVGQFLRSRKQKTQSSKEIAALRSKIDGLDLMPALPLYEPSDDVESVLVVGDGGAGKSTLIHRLFDLDVGAMESTPGGLHVFGRASCLYTPAGGATNKLWFIASDYRGQRGVPPRELLEEGALEGGPKIVPVNTLIIVVDVAPAPIARNGDQKPATVAHAKRSAGQWGHQSLAGGVFQKLDRGCVRSVALFVNKMDLVALSERSKFVKAFAETSELLRRFADANSADMQCFVGSALTGEGVPELRAWVLRSGIERVRSHG